MGTSTRSARARSAPAPPPRIDTPPLGSPLFVLNLKTYPSSLGSSAVELARHLRSAGEASGVAVAIAPAMPDLGRVAGAVEVPVLAQHADPRDAGASTGYVPPEAISAAGARGSLVNHSEHPLSIRDVAEVLARLHVLKLAAVVCAPDPAAAGRLAALRPSYLAVEPPELIGGTRAVSTARPQVVVEAVAAVHAVAPSTVVLCGAGVHRREDVRRALELGSQGVLVASAVTRAPDPRRVIDELLSGF